MGALVYDATLDDPELVEAVRAAAGIALENQHLHTESEARLAALQASRQRIVAAGDAERRRVERDLHDGAQQRLVAVSMQLRLIQADIRRDPEAAEQLVTSAGAELARSLEELRELARGIHPPRSTTGCRWRSSRSRRGPPCPPSRATCRAGSRRRSSSPSTSSRARRWRTSAGTPGRAQPRCTSLRPVAASRSTSPTMGPAAPRRRGSGLGGLTDRVEALDGHLLVTSPPGRGTVIVAELPCRLIGEGNVPAGARATARPR